MNDECAKCRIRSGDSFSGWEEYHRLARWLGENPSFLRRPVEEPLTNVGLREEWYECTQCGRVFRLIEPDPPFKGLWELV